MSSIDNLAKDLYRIIHDKEEKGPKPSEPVAKVVKVDSDIVWVKIPGGESETPVEKTVNAKVGDRVRVRLSGGRGWIIGNATSPPTDDSVAYNAQSIAITASGMAKDANDAANLAIEKVDQSIIDMAEQVIRIDGDISSLQDQIDGNITTWFYAYEPTDENYPANEWILEGQENEHLGDLFYDTTTGYAYRWMSDGDDPPTYSWSRITDTDVTKALADAAAAQDTADHKRRVFITQPVPPYDVGDLWFVGTTGDILTCTTSKTEEQSYSLSDWNKLNKYTDDAALNTFLSGTYISDKTNLQQQIDGKAETWYQINDPSSAWTTAELRSSHEGDLWYRTTDDTTWYWNGSAWSQQNIPSSVFDKIDGKAQIFTSQPSPPYDVGDLWFNSSSSDIMTCINGRDTGNYVASDWEKRNKYTDDSALISFISGTYSSDKIDLKSQIDGKAETWYQSNDPSTNWTTTELRSSHEGDLWYKTTDKTTWYWNGIAWSQQNVPDEVFDKIDGKAQVFTTQPVPPYDIGDIWFVGATGDILTCVNARTSGNYVSNDWQKRNKYTDDAALNTFISGTYATDKTDLKSQIDGKAETWYQATDPSTAWTTTALKNAHEGDLWYKTSDKTTWYWNGTSWVQEHVPDEVFDKIDGKAQIFTSQPVPPYNVGDLWFNSSSSDIMTCMNARSSGNYSASDWQKRNKYTDDQLAQSAWDYADSAHTAATNAWNYADDAHDAAITANRAANDALTQLSVVEEVVDTLNWISEHGTYKLSTDTTVNAQKMYFTLTGTAVSISTLGDGTKLTNLESYYEKSGNIYIKTTDTVYNSRKTYYTVSADLVINPTGNPNTNRYYEIYDIDTAVQNYISSHLSLTDSGLYVVKDNQGYKVLLANDGLKIYDNQGHLVSTFGENIIFDSSRPQTIGNSNTYIKWYDSNNDHVADSIEIAGANVNIASGVTIGGMPTKVSDLTNDSGYQTTADVNTAISNIEIGGKNLLLNTRDYANYNLQAATGSTLTIESSEPTDILVFSNVASGSTSIYQAAISKDRIPYSLIRNKNVIFSMLIKIAQNAQTGYFWQLELYEAKTGGTRIGFTNRNVLITGTGEWEKEIYQRTITDDIWTGLSITPNFDTCYVRISLWKLYTEGYATGFQAKQLKVEVGNKVTDWSPAPEDLAATATDYITDIENKDGITIKAVNSTTDNNATTGNYLKLNPTDGLNIYNGGVSVAKYGDTARIGKTSAPHVDIETTSITMSDGTRAVYEVKSTTGIVKVSRLYNAYLGETIEEGIDELLQLGRTINTLTSIIVTYSKGTTNYTKNFTSLPIEYGDSNIDITIEQETTSSLLVNIFGLSSVILKGVEINFTTSQQTVESTLGAYANKTASGAFRVGNGTATNALSNAMLVDWAGNAFLNGGLNVNCDADSSGGLSLTTPFKRYSAYIYDGSNYNLNINLFQLGYIVVLAIDFDKSTSTAAGGLVFNRSLTGAHIPVPIAGYATGYAPWSSNPIGVTLNDFGEGYALRIRNCGTTAATFSNVGRATLTYITDGVSFTDDDI